MLRLTLTVFMLPTLLLLGSSSDNSAAREKQKSTDVQVENVEKLVAASGSVTLDLAVSHLNGASLATEDMAHASMCTVSVLRKYRLAEPELIAQLDEIEELRPLFVRGDMHGGEAAAARALELLGAIAARARRLG